MQDGNVTQGMARPLGGERYTSREFMEAEWENVWTKTWLLTIRADDIPEDGDFMVEEIGRESILIVRQKDGSIKAFYNVCQHRGNKLVHEPEGSMPSFTCAYHSWRFEIDGTCSYAQDPEDFAGGDPCPHASLVEVECDVFAGFVWINMDPDCAPLKDSLGQIWDEWQAYPLEKMVRVQAMSVKMPCNWKLLMDNFHETYHLPTAHPEGIEYAEDHYSQTPLTLFDNGHALGQTHCCLPADRLPESKPRMTKPIEADLKAWDLDPADFLGREKDARKAVQAQKRKLAPERGLSHYDRLSDDQLTDVFHYTVFPNFATSLNADGMLFLRSLPDRTDPEKCVFDCWYYLFGASSSHINLVTAGGEGAITEAKREVIEFGEKSLGVVLDGDAWVMAGQQEGMRSRGYRGAILARQERRVAQYHDMIDRYIDGYRPAPRGAREAA
ncbi:(2Fe-2S)-binding protein [Novosphingobium marinum]|uniref:Phenylpropionate dioxygenase-like ring-hydroxylating dioxygenase large terminal subunit n=1 Tax=Novosphingobium marinum TaxID=1514948 RepID=A0A7Y9XT00_9SPHN|nr:aromatic ring-hydroxylating dioxygenase subunit alpha [Novosphingobium marinum]NYH94004.1 phenylpropionate dioxygenase-like ring-hydroxylating dioxygenase large terminal subunit [Novosphingobium marinum]GGC18862.1 (2Fe-2S)-binding protein [Novosphingobium marinum]